jgi:hypothetical protein
LALFLVLGGCAGTPERPDWVAGNSEKYPDSRFLVGRGQADTAGVARDRARSDLAKNFQVAISEESRDLIAFSGQTEGEETTKQLETEITRNIITQTDEVIEGVRIAEAWEDPETGANHALAALDRLQAGNNLRQVIGHLDEATRSSIERARKGEDLTVKIGAATRALTAQVERGHYQRYLKIIDRTGVGVPPAYDVARLKADLEDLLQRFRIAPRVVADPLGGLETVVSGGLARSGFLHETPENASHLLDVGMEVIEFSSDGGWQWVQGTLEIVLTDRPTARVLGTHRWEIKVSGQQRPVARKRAMDQVDRILRRELRNVILGFGTPEG